MSFVVDEKWLEDYKKRTGQSNDTREVSGKRNKYGNQRTESGGWKFDSKHEAQVYQELRLRCMAGEFLGLGLQVAFYLPGGIKYVADFIAFLPDGGYVVMDAKSDATRKDKVYCLKKKLMRECLHLEIVEV